MRILDPSPQRGAASAERTSNIGDAIGHYRVTGVAGDSSLGRLYVAEQRKTPGVPHTVALCCIREDLAQHPDFRASFAEAASIAPRLEHPNLVSIYEMNEADGSCFFSLEYVPGENVASILTKCTGGAPMSPDIAATIIKHAAYAVQYLHDLLAAAGKPVGPRHGELNPSNLFVTYHGTVKWLAVGLQTMRAQGPATSGEHAVDWSSHSSPYRAPEHGGGSADARSDVFSLGALLWTCLTGQRPRPARANGGDEHGSAAAPSSSREAVPEVLNAIVTRALSADPERRFQSPRELSEALDRYLLRRDSRPTHKHVRRWMEQLFDVERAALQLQIARGHDDGNALSLLGPSPRTSSAPPASRASLRARELWSTRHSVFSELERGSVAPPRPLEVGPRSLPHDRLPVSEVVSREGPSTLRAVPSLLTPPSAAAPVAPASSRAWVLGGVIAVCVLIAAASAVFLSSSGSSSPLQETPRETQVAERSGQLEVRSNPEGAAVFVDGEPTGLRTPARLKGLAAGRALRLRIEKPGFASQEREVQVAAGSAETLSVELLPSDGLVQFAGMPEGARLFVDDAPVTLDGKPVSLSVGRHEIRVEMQGSLVFSGTVMVVAGEQTIPVDGAGAAP